MSLAGKSLYVLTPMYGGNLTVNYHNAFVQLCNLCRETGVELGWSNIYNESLISRARNRLVDTYLKQSTATHAVFIDADIGFDCRDILAMMETDYDIVGVPCSKKSIRWDRIQLAVARRVFEWIAMTHPNGSDPDTLAHLFRQSPAAIDSNNKIDLNGLPYSEFSKIGGDFVLNFPAFEGEKVLEINKPEMMKHLGTGLLMIKRDVFKAFKQAYPDRWYEPKSDPNSNPGQIHDFFKVGVNPESREYDSEDFWFVHDCKAIGYKVWMLPWVKTTHMGTNTFVGDMPAALVYSGEII